MATTRGARRHVVTFENPGVPFPDSEGGYSYTWEPLSPPTWYVSIRPATTADAERAVAGTQITHASHVIEGDYHPEITTRTRMVFEGRVYQVTSVVNVDERRLAMELIADLQS